MTTWATQPLSVYIEKLAHHDPRVRRQAAAALEILGDSRAVEPLLGALDDAHAEVRGNVARALGKYHEVRVVLPLIQTIGDQAPTVRIVVIRALGGLLGLREESDALIVEALLSALNGTSLERDEVGRIFLRVHDPRIVSPLANALKQEVMGKTPGTHGGHSIAVALGRQGETAVPFLLTFLSDEEAQVREMAALGLQYVKDDRAVEPLRQALTDADPMVRHKAQQALHGYE